jgi:hypothetical protein
LVDHEESVDGHKIVMKMEILGKRSQTLHIHEDKLGDIPKENIISVEDLTPTPFPKAEPSSIALAGHEAEHEAAWQSYRAEKEEWEKHNAVPEGIKRVNAWVPVTKVHKAEMDGFELKIFHTLRGPIMAAVQSEDMNRAFVYSPCMIDPNISRGRIHFLPIAFAGYRFTIYKTSGIGESVPQEAEVRGYPSFVNNNQKGDYAFRMKASYHHIEADLSDDSKVVSVELATREAQEGLVPTSDTQEKKAVDRVRQARALTEAAKEEADAAPPTPPEASTPVEGDALPAEPPPAQVQEEASSA